MSDQSSRPHSYAAVITCLRCDQRFFSWDQRQNRLCVPCRECLETEPSPEDIFVPPKRHRPTHDA
jgi:hypothetical protein